MRRGTLRMLTTVVSLAAITGCARRVHDGFDDVRSLAQQRAGAEVVWIRGDEADHQVAARIRESMRDELTLDEAAQAALLNNRDLQATYEELGVAQAELVEAGLLENPVFEAEVRFAEGGGGTAVEMGMVQSFVQLLMIPLRKKIAASAFEEAKLRVTGKVLELAGEVRAAFYDHQAEQQMLEMRRTVLAATEASDLLAQRLREAGNITELHRAQERAQHEQAKLDLAAAEARVLATRERLNEVMGLWGEQTTWRTAERLPDVPADEVDLDAVEQTAVSRSLDLAAARERIVRSARQYGLRRSFSLAGEAEVGASAEREAEGEWLVGPAFSLPIPLFNQGQASTAVIRGEMRRARNEYAALAVRIRSRARAARERLIAARDRAQYYRRVMLPLRRQIVEESQRQFNAMAVSPFELLRAKQQEIEAGAQYVDALREYWLARAELAQILGGRITTEVRRAASQPRRESGSGEAGGH